MLYGMITQTDIAYTAGYIDGDGCFFIGKIKTSPFYQDTFSIISTDIENIEWFKSRFNGNIHIKKTRQINRVPSYHFVFSKEGMNVLHDIYPYLVEKKEECNVFLQFIKRSANRDYLVKAMKILKNESNLIHHSHKENIESIRNTIVPSELDFAYLAGFVDAECSLDINRTIHKNSKNFTYRIQLQCNNTKFPFFYWASQRFGGQFHFLDKSKKINCRNQMLWRVSCVSLLPILEGIFPFLKHKKQNCAKMIECQKLTPPRKGSPSPNHPQYEEFFAPIRQKKEEIYFQVRHLNNTII